ncbi:gas vesicle protein K [Actinomadura scrupuli]|uniref:gas vesicle protein K n=1 Tax=Actinomadura scrupuli TaxID=559629 RepID=UPI003D980FAE
MSAYPPRRDAEAAAGPEDWHGEPPGLRAEPQPRRRDPYVRRPEPGRRLHGRLETDAEEVQRDLVRLVLTLIELVRQLMERQALRRVDTGDLPDDKVEELGLALMRLDEAMKELQERFDIDSRDLNLDLGPLGPLLPPE